VRVYITLPYGNGIVTGQYHQNVANLFLAMIMMTISNRVNEIFFYANVYARELSLQYHYKYLQ